MDIKPGNIKLKRKGGDAGHNGMKSVIRYSNTKDFPRIYIGIGSPQEKGEVVKHVLGEPDPEEMKQIQRGVKKAVEAVVMLLENTNIDQVMEYANKRDV